MKFVNLRVFVLGLLLVSGFKNAAFAETQCPPEFSEPTAEQIEIAKKKTNEHGYLWEVTKDGKTSYVYGTIHVGSIDWIFPGKKTLTALRNSKKLALELNLGDPKIMTEIVELMKSNSEAKLSDALQERIKQYAGNNCMNFEQLQNLRPEFQVLMLTIPILKKEKLYSELSVDLIIAGVANALKIPIIGLETPKEQMSILFSKSGELEQDIQEAMEKLEDQTQKKVLEKLVDAWANSDFEVLNAYAEWCKCTETQKEREALKQLIDERNITMVTRFDRIHSDEGKIFMAVGSLHMVGPMGVPSLLKKQGYSVVRLH